MTSQDEFQKAMHDIYKYSPLIGLEGQEVLQHWVQRLASAGSAAGSDQELRKALDYARYLAYQLEKAQLRFPFAQSPTQDPLPDLKEVLFGAVGAGAVADSFNLSLADDSLDQSSRAPPGRQDYSRKDYSLDTSLALRSSPARRQWQGRQEPRQDRVAASPRRTVVADPKCERDIVAQLEDLAEDAPLWLLLTRLCPYTLDGGSLLHAVVAEELAEWSARLAAEQTVARGRSDEGDEDEDDEGWGPRADRRADYWHEIGEAERSVSDDPRSTEHLATEMDQWLNLQNRQMQAEQAQLQALVDELQGIQRQVAQSQSWRVAQFERQNRVLEAEVAALRQSIAENATKVRSLKSSRMDSSASPGTQKALSISEDSLNASAQSP